jgi:hypothetical protein
VIVILVTAFFCQEILILLLIAIIALGIGLGFFLTLTVEITSHSIDVIFGPIPLLRRVIPFDMIKESKLVKYPWYYGYGIRWIPNGKLYNVSGSDALELTLITGKRVLIGTDDPERLAEVFGKITQNTNLRSDS